MGKLILLRHGESVWNQKNVFTGWVDVPLSVKGIAEATEVGKKMADISFDAVFTSVQIRAIETAMIALAQNKSQKTPVIIHTDGKMAEWAGIYSPEMRSNIVPVYRDWHLNERYYGELQGQNKAETAALYGDEQVRLWRRSYDIAPPHGEGLKDTAERTIPFFNEKIMLLVKEDKNILVSAHGNSLRSIVMFIENLSKEEVLKLEIQTGSPIVFSYKDGGLINEEL